jgi:hypothetical protein
MCTCISSGQKDPIIFFKFKWTSADWECEMFYESFSFDIGFQIDLKLYAIFVFMFGMEVFQNILDCKILVNASPPV